MCDTIKVRSYADDSASVDVRVNEDRTAVFIEQGTVAGDPWTGDTINFAIENADAVIEAIRTAVARAKGA